MKKSDVKNLKFTKGVLKLVHGLTPRGDLNLTATLKWGKSEEVYTVKYDTGSGKEDDYDKLLKFFGGLFELKLEFSGPATEYSLVYTDQENGRLWDGGGIFNEVTLKFDIQNDL